MLGTKRVAAIIAARGGSKGLPGKNVAPCAGKPLIGWSVEAALGSKVIDRTILSTDDAEIAECARRFGADVPFLRPAQLATDTATMDGVVLHALDVLAASSTFDIAVLLQATSPLRTSDDIDGALAFFERPDTVSVVSVTEPTKSPYWMYTTSASGRLEPLFPEAAATSNRRQELPPVFVLNGALYAFDVSWFRERRRFTSEETLAYRMPPERSVDVDTALDLVLADHLLRGRTR